MMAGPRTAFDIVLATRNRASVLRLSVPLMLSHDRPPYRFIVVDSSDHYSEVREVVESACRETNTPAELILLRSQAGSSHQRNEGLKHVQSPVVFFPDDDVLWFPDTADKVMRIYDRDQESVIGCVAPAVASSYPTGTFGSAEAPYRMEGRDRVSRAIRALVGPVEQRLFPDPVNPGSMWMALWGARTPPVWLDDEDAELCGPVFGYRMSFRTEAIRKLGGFDECLGRYAMFEDSDASLGSLQVLMNVCAKRAKVFHYRVPGERASGWEFGMMAILNRTYVACKHSRADRKVRRMLKRYLYYKIVRYGLQTYTQYGRARLRGALYGLSKAQQLIESPMEQLKDRYLTCRYNGAAKLTCG
jgi:glycosyltransferase involved in cell wall biosynthesis